VLISKLNGCLFLFERLGDHQLVRYCNRLLFAETEKVSRDLPNSILKFNGSFVLFSFDRFVCTYKPSFKRKYY
jgi:hypothetical protein